MYQYDWYLFAKLCTKNHKNPCIAVKVIVKKSVAQCTYVAFTSFIDIMLYDVFYANICLLIYVKLCAYFYIVISV